MKNKTKDELKQLIQDQFKFHFNSFTDAVIDAVLGTLKNSNADVIKLKDRLEAEKAYSKDLEKMVLELNEKRNEYKERANDEEP